MINMTAKGGPQYTTLGIKSLDLKLGKPYVRDFIVYRLRGILDGEKERVIQGLCNSEMGLIFQGSLLDKLSYITSCQSKEDDGSRMPDICS